MRIAIFNSFARLLGGSETYLDRLIPALARAGQELAMLYEMDAPQERAPISNAGAPVWHISELGIERALRELRRWRPQLIYTNAISNSALEQTLQEIAPAVHFAHDYAATCISGSKAFGFPNARTCSHPCGPKCLVNYFPRRCGGLSPITMWRRYQLLNDRRSIMRRYGSILVASEAMRLEYVRNGLAPAQIEVAPYPASPPLAFLDDCHHLNGGELPAANPHAGTGRDESVRQPRDQPLEIDRPPRLLFAGRMLPLKGGEMLLRAMPHAAAKLGRPLTLIMAGDGSARSEWEVQARLLSAQYPAIRVEFRGWLGIREMNQLIGACELLVIPSLWPEPFGLIGPEAGMRGVPAAAFALGGITQWLIDGVNGFLASANPPSAIGLAEAIAKCLRDPSLYRRLRRGARNEAMKFSLERHLAKLQPIFARAAAQPSVYTRTACR